MPADVKRPVATREVTARGTTVMRRCAIAAFGTLLCAAMLAAMSSSASAATNVTLYVSKSGTAATGCVSAAHPCATIADGIRAAGLLAGKDVTIDVAASKSAYAENLTIDDPTTDNPTLTIKGAGATSTTLDGSNNGSNAVKISTGDVFISGLKIDNAPGTYGGAIDNDGTLTLSSDTLSDSSASLSGGGLDNNGTATLSHVTLSDDSTGGDGDGGAIWNGGPLTLTSDTLSGDSSPYGGAIWNGATAHLNGDTIVDDSATQGGAGVYNQGTVTLTGGKVSDNTGDGIYNTDGTAILTGETVSHESDGGFVNGFLGVATLTKDTLSDDQAYYGGGVSNGSGDVITLTGDTLSKDTGGNEGGAFYNDGTATVTDDTLSGDSSPNYGGGVYNSNYGTATLTDDTLSGDSSYDGGGILNDGRATLIDDTLSADTSVQGGKGGGIDNGSTLSVTASILDAAPCYYSTSLITDGGYNVESDNTCGLGGTSKLDNKTIDLATSLAHNGSTGPETLAITPASSAFEEVPSVACTVKADERALPRPGIPSQTSCDAGAFELQASVPAAPRDVRATAGNKSITLHWSAPASDGGLAISGYRVYCSKTHPVSTGGAPSAEAGSSRHFATVKALKDGTKYYCVVTALNAKGTSPSSSTASATPG